MPRSSLSKFLSVSLATVLTLAHAPGADILEDFHFINRSLVNGKILLNSDRRWQLPFSGDEHTTFCERSLLIRSTLVVNSVEFCTDPTNPYTPGRWSFQQIIERAFAWASIRSDEVEKRVNGWVCMESDSALGPLRRAWSVCPNQPKSVNTIPLRLLAVVNRLDLAKFDTCQEGWACQPEVRFVYGAVTQETIPPFSLIIEFVLRGQRKNQFKAVATRWADLARLEGGNYLSALANLLGSLLADPEAIRIRVIGVNSGSWDFSEYYFVNGKGLVPHLLEQQPHPYMASPAVCQEATSKLACFTRQHLPEILRGRQSFDKTFLQTSATQILESSSTVLTLAPNTLNRLKRAALDDARASLSISSCAGCHGYETLNAPDEAGPFAQVKYRDAKCRSRLSNFLTGDENASGGGDPTLKVWTMTPVPVRDGSCSKVQIGTRYYNDLLRRHLFLYEVLHLDPNASNSVWSKALEETGLYSAQVE